MGHVYNVYICRYTASEMASRILLAAEQGDRKSMAVFITSGQVDVVDEEGCTPLMVAAANGRDEIIRQLLEQEVRMKGGR